MKKILLLVGIALLAGLGGGYGVSQVKQKAEIADTSVSSNSIFGKDSGNKIGSGLSSSGKNGQPNRENCLSDDCLLVEDLDYPVEDLPEGVQKALEEAIIDEYKAHATYEAVLDKFGSTRPFSMIIGAEEQHIASLKAIFNKYGLEIPKDTWTGNVVAPESLQQACQTGVDAEIANAGLYEDSLLPSVKDYADITTVFTNLMNASQDKHLPAFEKCN